jgi:hypothetical protein
MAALCSGIAHPATSLWLRWRLLAPGPAPVDDGSVLPLLLAVALCPADMVAVPGGVGSFGGDGPRPKWQEAADERDVGAFCIDRYEFPNQLGELPRVDVSWAEARDLCTEQSKRLCSADEWERACRGPQGTTYAYGDEFDRAACNTPLDTGGPVDDEIPFAPAGSHARCRSSEGAFDLNGNVSEWVEDPWDAERFGVAEGQGPGGETDDLRQLRGGTMWSGTFYGQSCLSRHAHPSVAQSDDDGFRCCAGPKAAPAPTPTPSRGALKVAPPLLQELSLRDYGAALTLALVVTAFGLWVMLRPRDD